LKGGNDVSIEILPPAFLHKWVRGAAMAAGLGASCLGFGSALAADAGKSFDPAALMAVQPKAAAAMMDKKGTAADKAPSLPEKHSPRAPGGAGLLPQRLPIGGREAPTAAKRPPSPAVGLPMKLPATALGSAVKGEKRKASGPKPELRKLLGGGSFKKQGDGPGASKALPAGKAILPPLPAAGLAGDKKLLSTGTGNRVPVSGGPGASGFLPAISPIWRVGPW